MMSEKKKTTFVAIETTGFSGATLLTSLLSSHPEIATVAEMSGLIQSVDPDKYLCSCGQKIKVCEFWQLVKAGMIAKGFEFDIANFNTRFSQDQSSFFSRLREGSSRINLIDSIRDAILFALPGEVKKIQEIADRNVAFIETILEITGKKVFLDSSKERMRSKALRKFTVLDTKIIHLVRDVRGQVSSRLRRDNSITASQAARDWYRLHQRVEVNLKSWPVDKQILVRYEDLCENTEATLRQLYTFSGVDIDHEIIDPQPGSQHIIGNPMRLMQTGKIKLDERWKDELTSEQLNDIKHICSTMSHQYGYD